MSWSARLSAQVGALRLDVTLEGGGAPVALIGPNGAGKTSLLRWLAGQTIEARDARLEVDGRVLVDLARGIWEPPETRAIGYVPQGYGLFAPLRVLDNVAFGLASRGRSRGVREREARRQLAALDAEALADRWPRDLSGGEQQRVALARALVTAPRLLLLDEPMAALDVTAKKRTRRFLAEHLERSEASALVVTHDPRDVRALAAHVYVMEDGLITQAGTPAEPMAAPATEFVAEFFDASP